MTCQEETEKLIYVFQQKNQQKEKFIRKNEFKKKKQKLAELRRRWSGKKMYRQFSRDATHCWYQKTPGNVCMCSIGTGTTNQPFLALF